MRCIMIYSLPENAGEVAMEVGLGLERLAQVLGAHGMLMRQLVAVSLLAVHLSRELRLSELNKSA